MPESYDVYVRIRLDVLPEEGLNPPSEDEVIKYVQSGVDLIMQNGFPDSNPRLAADYAQVTRVVPNR